MTMDFEDEEDFNICGIVFRGTKKLYRKIHRAYLRMPEYRVWAALDNEMRYGDFLAKDHAGALATKVTDAEIEMVSKLHDIVAKELS